MNSETLPHQPASASPPAVQPSPHSSSGTVSLPPNAVPLPLLANRGNGKIARLSKALRDQINLMLLDGLPYPQIAKRLGDAGKDLKPGHLHEWKKRGYQDWLQQRQWLEHITTKSEFSIDLLATPDSATLHEAGLRLAAACMLDQLSRFAAASPDAQPEIFARLVNALSRLTREALSVQKYHDACLAQLKQADPNRNLTHHDHNLFRKRAEELFHVRLPKFPPPDDFLESP